MHSKKRDEEIKSILTKGFCELEYVEKGKTYNQISIETNISKELVMRYCKMFGIKSRNTGHKRTPIKIGETYGSLTVLNESKDDKNRLVWECVCSCGSQVVTNSSSLMSGKDIGCYTCRNSKISDRNWKGVGDISGDKFGAIKRSAKKRNIIFEISIEYCWNLFIKQDKKCKLSGLDIHFSRNIKGETTASLDRIDSSKGYIEGNVQWLHKTVNKSKWDLSQNDFIELCRMVSKYNEPNSKS